MTVSRLPVQTKLEILDNLNGSVNLAWPDPLPGGSLNFNVYVRLVTFTPVYQPPSGAFGPSAQAYRETDGAWTLATNVKASPQSGNADIILEDGTKLILEGGGYVQLEGDPYGYQAGVSGLQVPSYNATTGALTPPQTYDFMVVAVDQNGEEIGSLATRVTPQPSVLTLVTPMKRLWPFPNTGLD